MAVAARHAGEDRRVVAVIGDGAMTAGMAFEALNNAGAMDANLLVILNDNDMSISENVGALNNYLARLMSGRFYAAARRAGERMLSALPAGAGLRPPRRGACEGHGDSGHAVRGVRLQLYRSHRRARPRRAGGDSREHPGAGRPPVPARGHPQGQGLQAGGGRSHPVSRCDQVRSRRPASSRKPPAKPTYTQIFGDWLCDMAAARFAG